MTDRPSPEDVIEARLRPMVLFGGSHVMTSCVVSALHDAGYVIVSAEDAAKLDRLREAVNPWTIDRSLASTKWRSRPARLVAAFTSTWTANGGRHDPS